jgi:Alpha/beta hydrolase domain
MQNSGKRAGRHSLVRYAAVLVIDHRVSIAGQDQMRRRAGVDAGWSTVERSSFPQANDSERRPSRIHQLYPNRKAYLDRWQAALDRGVAEGFILSEDVPAMKAVADKTANTIFPK